MLCLHVSHIQQKCNFLHLNAHLLSCQMTYPAIQNDFSYYRRTLSRMRIINQTVSKPALYGNMPHYQTAYVLVILRSPVSQGLMGALLFSNDLNHSVAEQHKILTQGNVRFRIHLNPAFYFVRLPPVCPFESFS